MTGSNDHIDESAGRYDIAAITSAADALKAGALVAVPTETVYGLAADSTNAAAIAAIYRTKGRPDFNPLIVHVPDRIAADQLGVFDDLASRLAEKFWPGPLTLVVPKAPHCPAVPAVTAGLDTIALRMPAHPVMRALLAESGLSLAAPSANKSGGISPTSPEHVTRSLGSDAPMILDGGASAQGLESTIVAIRGDGYEILRPGPITQEALEACTGQRSLIARGDVIEAPGQLSRHYAPGKPIRLAAETADPDEFHIGFGEIAGDANLSSAGDLAEAASNLFALLHQADESSRAGIAVAPVPTAGIGAALNDRLRRAAS